VVIPVRVTTLSAPFSTSVSVYVWNSGGRYPTVKVAGSDVPPPGPGVSTVTIKVDSTIAVSDEGTVNVRVGGFVAANVDATLF
jgi:hypothetical protein